MEHVPKGTTEEAAPYATLVVNREQMDALDAVSRQLDGLLTSAEGDMPVIRLVAPGGEVVQIAGRAVEAIRWMTSLLTRCESMVLVPVEAELTTQKAADILNVSRQYLIRLLRDGRIPFRMTGRHRRLRLDDVLAYKAIRDKDRRAGMEGLVRMTEAFGGYDHEFEDS